ncbi:unnamed protein product, partial [Discosporangium mesarthrocarpum]
VTWERRHDALVILLKAARFHGYPWRGDSISWTSRASRWEDAAMEEWKKRVCTTAQLQRSGRRIVQRAERLGWDLRPSTRPTSTEEPDTSNSADEGVVQAAPSSERTLDHTVETLTPPEAWTELSDEGGNVYFFNSITGESTWESPHTAWGRMADAVDLTDTWWEDQGQGTGEHEEGWFTDNSGWGGATSHAEQGDYSNPFSEYHQGQQAWGSAKIYDEVNQEGYTARGDGWSSSVEQGEHDGGWTQQWDESGNPYWYNASTGESSW